VANALYALGYHVSHVGNVELGEPDRGATDEEVLEHAKRRHQFIVTENHDMILLCIEQGRSAVWLDPRGRQFESEKLTVLFLLQIREWETRLRRARGPVVVHALRTKVEVLTLQRAKTLVMRRQRDRQRRERAAAARPSKPLGGLWSDG
jgi:predicted nuclease of predicted toxin-antitoxin system